MKTSGKRLQTDLSTSFNNIFFKRERAGQTYGLTSPFSLFYRTVDCYTYDSANTLNTSGVTVPKIETPAAPLSIASFTASLKSS